MTGNALPVADYTVTVTNGSGSGTFTFRVRKQGSSTKALATLSSVFERYSLSFQVEDITDYGATTNPRTTFGTAFTNMLISALRSLVAGGTSMIPVPDALVNFGSSGYSYVDTVEISQLSEDIPDVFLVTCDVREATATTMTPVSTEPQVNRTDEIPPWQMPADVSFDCQTTEGMTLGFAYPVSDLDGKKVYGDEDLRSAGYATSSKAVAVENYAKDPFASPPAFPKVNGTLRISKAFLRGGGVVDLSSLHGTVNDKSIAISVEGATFVFAGGTLSPTIFQISPKIYQQPIPWLPKTAHPLNKTYGELFYGYSRTTANRIAVNKTAETLLVYRQVRYIEVSAAFSFRPEGYAVWLANRGYAEVDTSSTDGLKTITDTRGVAKEMWLTKEGKKTTEERIWRGYTMVRQSDKVERLLLAFYPADDTFAWATASDNFGSAVRR